MLECVQLALKLDVGSVLSRDYFGHTIQKTAKRSVLTYNKARPKNLLVCRHPTTSTRNVQVKKNF